MTGNWPVKPYIDPRTGLPVQYAYPASGNLVYTFHAPPHPPVTQVYSLPPPNPYAYAYPPWPPQIRIHSPPLPHFAVAAPQPIAPAPVPDLQAPARQQPSPSLSVSPSPTVGSTSSSRPSSTASVVAPRYEAPAPRQDSPPCEAQLRDQRNYKPPAPGMSSDSAASPIHSSHSRSKLTTSSNPQMYAEATRDLQYMTVDRLKSAIRNINNTLYTSMRLTGKKSDLVNRSSGEMSLILRN